MASGVHFFVVGSALPRARVCYFRQLAPASSASALTPTFLHPLFITAYKLAETARAAPENTLCTAKITQADFPQSWQSLSSPFSRTAEQREHHRAKPGRDFPRSWRHVVPSLLVNWKMSEAGFLCPRFVFTHVPYPVSASRLPLRSCVV